MSLGDCVVSDEVIIGVECSIFLCGDWDDVGGFCGCDFD